MQSASVGVGGHMRQLFVASEQIIHCLFCPLLLCGFVFSYNTGIEHHRVSIDFVHTTCTCVYMYVSHDQPVQCTYVCEYAEV